MFISNKCNKNNTMAIITVRVPDTIKQTMDSYEEINWSAVIRSSLNEKLEELYLQKALIQAKKDIANGKTFTQKQIEEMFLNEK